jgi:hypothetical protein
MSLGWVFGSLYVPAATGSFLHQEVTKILSLEKLCKRRPALFDKHHFSFLAGRLGQNCDGLLFNACKTLEWIDMSRSYTRAFGMAYPFIASLGKIWG